MKRGAGLLCVKPLHRAGNNNMFVIFNQKNKTLNITLSLNKTDSPVMCQQGFKEEVNPNGFYFLLFPAK